MDTCVDTWQQAGRTRTAIRTTLYDLIAAINAEVEPEEEHLVVATVVHLLENGRITFLRDLNHRN